MSNSVRDIGQPTLSCQDILLESLFLCDYGFGLRCRFLVFIFSIHRAGSRVRRAGFSAQQRARMPSVFALHGLVSRVSGGAAGSAAPDLLASWRCSRFAEMPGLDRRRKGAAGGRCLGVTVLILACTCTLWRELGRWTHRQLERPTPSPRRPQPRWPRSHPPQRDNVVFGSREWPVGGRPRRD